MRSRAFLRAEQLALGWDAPGLMAGVDEAGRGPLAGPVVAAAVILGLVIVVISVGSLAFRRRRGELS